MGPFVVQNWEGPFSEIPHRSLSKHWAFTFCWQLTDMTSSFRLSKTGFLQAKVTVTSDTTGCRGHQPVQLFQGVRLPISITLISADSKKRARTDSR